MSKVGILVAVTVMTSVSTVLAKEPVVARHGMVATTHPQAVDIGVEILRRGGNAVDAAIATNAAMGVMEPASCGIGGDLFAIVWDNKTKKLYGINAAGRAPHAANIEAMLQRIRERKEQNPPSERTPNNTGVIEIPLYSPLAWSVPGCVDGWDELRRKFGTLSWEQLLTPSIEAAEKGFLVPETIGRGWGRGVTAPRLKRDPGWVKTFLREDGSPPEIGGNMTNRDLARTYREIVSGGRDAFYKGRIARETVAFSKSVGGFFEMRDFETHTSEWVDPVSTTYRGYRVWEIPPQGQGIAVLQMLNVLETFDVKKLGPGTPDWWHLFVETKRLAYADRAKFYADPAFYKAPVAHLISKQYAGVRAKMIDMAKAMPSVTPGDVALGGDTIYLTVVDKDRNCVSLIQSNYHGFGSGHVPPGLGFAIQNRGNLFSLDKSHANRLEPGKRPFHTIIPAMVTRDDDAGRPWFCFGVMGGDMQPQGHVQVLVNIIDHGMNIQAAGDFPRLEHLKSATPTSKPEEGVGLIEVEPGISDEVVKELERRGHRTKRIQKNGGGYQGILIDWEKGTLQGASESRRDGKAAGY
jgi:gamma-glutamyltranspeptidase/glutathione hydrolase